MTTREEIRELVQEAEQRALGEIWAEALAENAQREMDEATAWQATPAYRRFAAIVGTYQDKLDTLQGEALDEDAERGASQPPRKLDAAAGSGVVLLLEKVWSRVRADHPELPDVVIVTGSGLTGASKWGHFRPDGWKTRADGTRMHEVFMGGETLAKGADQVLQTMLHEAAHTLARVRDLKDTSRQGRWHNQVFRKVAAELGLEHLGEKPDKAHGYSTVVLTAATRERYADLLAELGEEIHLMCDLPGWLGGTGTGGSDGGEKIAKPTGEPEARSGSLKAVCECPEPNIIRLSRKVLDLGLVRCDGCEALFTVADR